MKNLTLLSILSVMSFTQFASAQEVAKSIQAGKLGNIIWNKDLLDVTASANGIAILSVEQDNDEAKAMVNKFETIAKQFTGKYAILKIDIAAAAKAGSSLATQLKGSPANLDIILISNNGIGENALSNDYTAEQIAAAIDSAFVAYASGGASAAGSAPEGLRVTAESPAKAIEDIKSLKKHNFNEVFEAETDEELKALLADSKNVPVVIDFSGVGWCGPCASFEPAFKAAAKAFGGKVRFVLVNIKRGGPSSPPSGSELMKTGGVPEVQVFRDGAGSGQEIQVSRDANSFTHIVSQATGIKP